MADHGGLARAARAAAIALLLAASPAASQQIARFDAALAQPQETDRTRAFGVELLGGSVGSLAGFGLGVLAGSPGDCDSEDLECILGRVGLAIAGSTVGAAAGAYLAGRAGDTDPSALGASAGAIAGALAGIGVIHLLEEELNVTTNAAALVVSYALTQGLLTAAGSRLARW